MPNATHSALTYAEPDATADFFTALSDPNRWIRKQAVPLFKPHVRTDPNTGKEIKVDLAKLHRIADNMQRLENEGGVPVRITLGHTAPGQPETKQPPVAGYYRNARVGVFGPKREPAIIADEWLDPQYGSVRKNFPYRSSEYYDDDEHITGVALLARDPYLDLGVVAYSRSSPGPVHYSRVGTPAPYLYLIGDPSMPQPQQTPTHYAEPVYPQYGQPVGETVYGAPQNPQPPVPVMYAYPQPGPVEYDANGQPIPYARPAQYGGPWPGPAYTKHNIGKSHSSKWDYRNKGARPTAYAPPQGQRPQQGQQQGQQAPRPYYQGPRPQQRRPQQAPQRPAPYADNFGGMGGPMGYDDEFPPDPMGGGMPPGPPPGMGAGGPPPGMGGPPPGGMGGPPPGMGGPPPGGMDPGMGAPGGDPAEMLPAVLQSLEQIVDLLEPMMAGMEPNDAPPDSPFPDDEGASDGGGGDADKDGVPAEEDSDDSDPEEYGRNGPPTGYAPPMRAAGGQWDGFGQDRPSFGTHVSTDPGRQMGGYQPPRPAPSPTGRSSVSGGSGFGVAPPGASVMGRPQMRPPTQNNYGCAPGQMYRAPQRPAPYRAPQRPGQRPARYSRTPGDPMPYPPQPAPQGGRPAPQQQRRRQAAPTQYGQAAARIASDRTAYELEQLKRQNEVLMYERDERDTEACVAEVRRLASMGYPVDEYEVRQLKATPKEHRQAVLDMIATRYSRVPQDGIAPMFGDPTPEMPPQDQGPRRMTREGMEEALRVSEQTGMDIRSAMNYIRGDAPPVAYGPQPGTYGPPAQGYPAPQYPAYPPAPMFPGVQPNTRD